MNSFHTSISPELRLLLAISDPEGFMPNIDEAELDWKRVRNLANWHQVQALLYKNVKNLPAVPASLLDSLHRESVAQTVANLMLMQESVRLAEIFKNRGIEAFLMKGALWASLYYEEIGLRQFGDIDFFIEKASLPGSIEAMEAAGYVADAYRTYLLRDPTRSYLYFDTDYQLPLESIKNQLIKSVELQWCVSYPRLKLGLEWSELMDAPVNCQIGGMSVQVPRPENQLLLMIMHHVGVEEMDKLKYGFDLVMLLRKNLDSLDWEYIMNKASSKGFLRMVCFGLQIAGFLDPKLEYPEWVQRKIDQKSQSEFIHDTFRRWEDSRNKPLTKSWRIVRHQIMYRDRWQDKLSIILAHAKYATEFNLLYHKARWYFG